MNRIRSIFIGTVLAVSILSFSLGWFFAKNIVLPKSDTTQTAQITPQDGALPPTADLIEVWSKLKNEYYDADKLQLSKLGFGAAKGLAAAIGDPYTVFMTPEESKDFGDELDGQVEGIGAQLEAKDGKLMVVAPLKNSPAEKAGIKSGDVILSIDGSNAQDMTIYDALKKIRGKKGTKVTLIVLHDKATDPSEITVTRDEIVLDTITTKKLENDIFYVAINQFNDHTRTEFENAIQQILLQKSSAVILDVRGNGGGYLDIAVDLLSELIDGKKPLVTIQKRDESKNETLNAHGNAKIGDMPLVVLIDGGSASASEILAGALQDYKRAVLIGEKSFGKGSVQEVDEFADGARLRMTIAHWLTPLKRSINGTGLTPDIEVKFTDADAKANRDPALDAAVNYLKTHK